MTRLPVPVLLGLAIFLVGGAFAAATPYRALVGIDLLGMTRASFGLSTTLGSVIGAGGSVFLGLWADRARDRRPLALTCVLMGALGYGLIWLFPSAFVMTLALAAFLPFGSAAMSQTMSYARAWHDEHRPGAGAIVISRLRATFSASWVVVPPAAGWLAARATPLDVMGAAALSCLGAASVMVFMLTLSQGATTRVTPKAEGMAQAFPTHRRIGVLAVVFFRVTVILHTMTLPLLMTHDIGASLDQVGVNAAIAAALEIPFMLAWGALIPRLGSEPILALSALIFAAYLVAMDFVTTVPQAYAMQAVNALGLSALLSVTISYMQDTIRGRVGLSTALMDAATVAATMIASLLFGFLPTGGAYGPLFLAAALAALLGAALIWLSRQLAPEG